MAHLIQLIEPWREKRKVRKPQEVPSREEMEKRKQKEQKKIDEQIRTETCFIYEGKGC